MSADGVSQQLVVNLERLAIVQPALMRRLLLPAASEHLDLEAQVPAWRINGRSVPLLIDDAVRHALVRQARAHDGEVLIFGAGDAVFVDQVLRALPPTKKVVVWDRDPIVLQELLAHLVQGQALTDGRLELGLNADIVALRDRIGAGGVLAHPLARERYDCEWRFLSRAPQPRRALVATGGLYVHSLETTLERAGFEVLPLAARELALDEHRHTIASFQPEFVAGINYTEGLAEFTAEIEVPLLVWEIDPSSTAPLRPDVAADHVAIFTYRRAQVAAWRAAGFERAQWLPLAADERLRQPTILSRQDRAQYAAPISFVGSSMGVNEESFRRDLLDAMTRHAEEPTRRQEMARELDAILATQAAQPQEFVIDHELQRRRPGFLKWAHAGGMASDPIVLAGELSARTKRLATVGSLAEQGMQVWGDEGWSPAVDAGVRYRGPAGHQRELTRIFNASDINLDIGRIFQSDIVTMRVFDIAASGGFVLAERSPDLEALFDVGKDIAAWGDEQELRELTAHYLAHPAERRAMAERTRAAVLDRHRFELRVGTMLEGLSGLTHAQPALAEAES